MHPGRVYIPRYCNTLVFLKVIVFEKFTQFCGDSFGIHRNNETLKQLHPGHIGMKGKQSERAAVAAAQAVSDPRWLQCSRGCWLKWRCTGWNSGEINSLLIQVSREGSPGVCVKSCVLLNPTGEITPKQSWWLFLLRPQISSCASQQIIRNCHHRFVTT